MERKRKWVYIGAGGYYRAGGVTGKPRSMVQARHVRGRAVERGRRALDRVQERGRPLDAAHRRHRRA
eukprot:scaffold43973_cov59-Phaeocystis_antarctica.AAC.3